VTAGRRILALVTDAWGGRGGIAQYNRDLLTAWSRSEEVAAITVLPRSAQDPVKPPPNVRQFRARPGRARYSLAALAATLAQPLDLVFCGHLYLGPLALLVAKLKGARLIVQLHGIEAWERPPPLQRLAVERAERVFCVSRYTRGAVAGWAAIPPTRIAVVPNTVQDMFSPGPPAAASKPRRRLLTVGRLDSRERYKGHDRVIEALASLVAAGRDVIYEIAGEGDDAERLSSLADRLGISDRVRFLGAVDSAGLVEAYRRADLFLMPSTGEGFGIAYLEAMACGTPALGFAVAGAIDPLDGLGVAIPEGSDLAAAIAGELDGPPPDPRVLSARVSARFGVEPFGGQAVRALAAAKALPPPFIARPRPACAEAEP
jgi:phosphatidylinositol alpha-1,6-mannosyltransferase